MNNNWHASGNWTKAAVPIGTDIVVIPATVPESPRIYSSDAECGELQIQSGSDLSIWDEMLTVNGDVTVEGTLDLETSSALLNIYGDLVYEAGGVGTSHDDATTKVRGDLICETGSDVELGDVDMLGPADAVISFRASTGGVNDLVVDKSGALLEQDTSSDTLRINGDLNVMPFTSVHFTGYDGVKLGGDLYDISATSIQFDWILTMAGAGDQHIFAGDDLQLNNLAIACEDTVSITGELDVNGWVRIESGVFAPGTNVIRLGGNWINSVGPAAFDETGSRVILDGSSDQTINSEVFDELELWLDSPHADMKIQSGEAVTCSIFDWVNGSMLIENGSFTALDLEDPSITWPIDIYDGSVDLHQDATSYVDVNEDISIDSGTLSIHGGHFTGSYWANSWACNIDLDNGAVLDFTGVGIVIPDSGNLLNVHMDSDCVIRTVGGFDSRRPGFSVNGGTLELYGSGDAQLELEPDNTLANLTINKGGARTQGGYGTVPPSPLPARGRVLTVPRTADHQAGKKPVSREEPAESRENRNNMVELASDAVIQGTLLIESGSLRFNSNHVEVSNDVLIQGSLIQEDPGDLLELDGSLEWLNGSTAVCTAGEIRAEDGLLFDQSLAQLSAGHTTKLAGYGPCSVAVYGTGSEIGSLSISRSTGTVQFSEDPEADAVVLAGDLFVDQYDTVELPGSLTMTGSAEIAENGILHVYDGGRLICDDFILSGEVQVEGDQLRFHDDLVFNSTGLMTITGSWVIGDAPASPDYPVIHGTLVMDSGYLTLENEGLEIAAGAVTQISGGTIRTGNKFEVLDAAGFQPTGGEVEFGGESHAGIIMPATCWFHDLRADKPAGYSVTLFDPLQVNGNLRIEYERLLCNGYDLTVNGSVYILPGGELDAAACLLQVGGTWFNYAGSAGFDELYGTVRFIGAESTQLPYGETFYRLEVNKTASGDSDLSLASGIAVTVTEDLQVLEGTLRLNDNTLSIGEDLLIDENGALYCTGAGGSQIRIAGSIEDQNAAHDSQHGVEPGQSVFRFEGSGGQALSSPVEHFRFNDLTIAQGESGTVTPAVPIEVAGNFRLEAGEFIDSALPQPHFFYGDLYAAAGTTWNGLPGRITFTGGQPQTFSSQGVCLFGDLAVTKFAEGLSLLSTLETIGGTLSINSGSLDLGGQTLRVQTGGAVNVWSGCTLNLGPDGRLELGSGITMEVQGTLSSLGTESLPATITSAGPGEYYTLRMNQGGIIAAEHTVFEYMGGSGVYVTPTGLVDVDHAFNGCTFRESAAGGQLLHSRNGQTLTCDGAAFPENTWGGAHNVTWLEDAGGITFDNVSGDFAGELY